MSRFFFIVVVVFLSACGIKPISKQVRNDFTLRFEGRETGLQERIRIDGYYVKRDTSYTFDVKLFFFDDGTFAHNFEVDDIYSNKSNYKSDSLFILNVSNWGLYQLHGDTIITQYINCASWMAPWYARETRFLIIDTETIKAIFSQPIGFEVSQELLKTRWHDLGRFTPARFVPTHALPPSDNWLKREKWLWRNEKDWERYMETSESNKK